MSKLTTAEDTVFVFKLTGRLAERGEEIAFLHIQDACEAITSAEYCDKLLDASIKIYALDTDVESRKSAGRILPSVELINYRQWVSLLMDKHHRIVSWTG